MTDDNWDVLLSRIESGSCTPFLGAGACAGTLPLGGDIARDWAKAHEYPLEDSSDLARVAQFVAVRKKDAMWPKDEIRRVLQECGEPNFDDIGEPHGTLAKLPLGIFITTNYDDFMMKALEAAGKDPKREICRWNSSPSVKEQEPVLKRAYVPTAANPVVFHLHGRLDVPESIVLTEDDYIDFLVAISSDPKLLPHQIKKALAGASLMFIGYRLADWDFRLLHRGIVMAGEKSLRRLSVTVQLPPNDPQRDYLEQYFGAMQVAVYWGDATMFATELAERWAAYPRG